MSTTEPMAAVQKYIDAFNKGDREGMGAMFSASLNSRWHGTPPVDRANGRSGLVSRRAGRR